MSRAKYPAECPVFEIAGLHWEFIPVVSHDGYVTGSLAASVIDDDGWFTAALRHTRGCKPITRAARELLRWSRQ